MIPNPFLQQVGPQIDSGYNDQPEVDPQMAHYNSMLRAKELNTRLQIQQMIAGQQQSNLGRGMQLAATQGGRALATTISSSTAASLGATAAPSAASTLGSGLGLAAAGYGAYKSNVQAGQNIHGLNQAIGSGTLDPQEEAALRQRSFNAGLVNAGIGGVGGALAGSTFGPVGTVVGALAGGSGGIRQAWQSEPDNQSRLQAQIEFQRHPFRR